MRNFMWVECNGDEALFDDNYWTNKWLGDENAVSIPFISWYNYKDLTSYAIISE